MSVHEKRKQEDAYTKTNSFITPSLHICFFQVHSVAISCSQFNVKMFFSLPNAFTTNKQNSEQRCRDGVINGFVFFSTCRITFGSHNIMLIICGGVVHHASQISGIIIILYMQLIIHRIRCNASVQNPKIPIIYNLGPQVTSPYTRPQ